VAYAIGVLEYSGLRRNELIERFAMLLRVVGPVRLNRIPKLLQSLVVGVAVLHDESADAFWVLERKTPTDGGTVVHDVHSEAFDAQLSEQAVDQFAVAVEGIGECGAVGHIALPETWIVGRDHVIAVRKLRNEIAEHMRGSRETVQKQHDRRVLRTCLAIENFDAVDRAGTIARDDRFLAAQCWLGRKRLL